MDNKDFTTIEKVFISMFWLITVLSVIVLPMLEASYYSYFNNFKSLWSFNEAIIGTIMVTNILILIRLNRLEISLKEKNNKKEVE